MALLVIRGADGKSHLIHSSQIGPQRRPAVTVGQWSAVWKRFDGEQGR